MQEAIGGNRNTLSRPGVGFEKYVRKALFSASERDTGMRPVSTTGLTGLQCHIQNMYFMVNR